MKIPGLTPGHKYYPPSVVLFPRDSRGLRWLDDGDGDGDGVTLGAIITVQSGAAEQCHDTSEL